MNYKVIRLPKFYLTEGNKTIEISETDVRNIQLLVSRGKMNINDFIVFDEEETNAIFRADGFMNNELKGMDINSELSLDLLINK